jgi:hypothetical protein
MLDQNAVDQTLHMLLIFQIKAELTILDIQDRLLALECVSGTLSPELAKEIHQKQVEARQANDDQRRELHHKLLVLQSPNPKSILTSN